MHFLPAFQREVGKFKKYMGDPFLDDMATYIKKFADVKFQMKTQNLEGERSGYSLEDAKEQANAAWEEQNDGMDMVKLVEEEMRKRGEL